MTVETLDYGAIRLHVTSDDERTKRIRSAAKEPETVDWLESLPPATCLYDIGACSGAYSFVAASLGMNVVAFEPSAPNYGRLVENCALNPDLKVLVLPFLLTWRTGLTTFGYSSLDPGAALHITGGESTAYTQPQIGWALDDLLRNDEIRLPPPTAMKIDVDGAEMAVLQGAQETLRRVRYLLVEIDDKLKHSRLVVGILDLWGFRISSEHPHGASGVTNVIFERR